MNVIAHGIDLVEIDRIAHLLDEHGSRFTERCFTDGERSYAESGRRQRTQRYAARFAAKEAVLKALGTGWRAGIRWRDVEVVRSADGEPGLQLDGRCAQLARDKGIRAWLVSLTHTGESAAASVIGMGGSG